MQVKRQVGPNAGCPPGRSTKPGGSLPAAAGAGAYLHDALLLPPWRPSRVVLQDLLHPAVKPCNVLLPPLKDLRVVLAVWQGHVHAKHRSISHEPELPSCPSPPPRGRPLLSQARSTSMGSQARAATHAEE